MTIESPNALQCIHIHGKGATWVDRLIAKHHYLGYTPPGARLRVAVWYSWIPVGAMMWGRPSARMEDQKTTLELTRFWLHNAAPKNSESKVMAESIKLIQKKKPEIKRLISYSDPSIGHEGVIYAASNWINVGETAGGCWGNDSVHRPNTEDVKQAPKLKWVYWMDPKKRERLRHEVLDKTSAQD